MSRYNSPTTTYTTQITMSRTNTTSDHIVARCVYFFYRFNGQGDSKYPNSTTMSFLNKIGKDLNATSTRHCTQRAAITKCFGSQSHLPSIATTAVQANIKTANPLTITIQLYLGKKLHRMQVHAVQGFISSPTFGRSLLGLGFRHLWFFLSLRGACASLLGFRVSSSASPPPVAPLFSTQGIGFYH